MLMKKLIPVIYLLCIHWISCAQEIPQKVPIPESELMRLPIKEIVANYYNGNFYIGTANHGKLIDELSGRIAAREFDYMTPANDFKQSYIPGGGNCRITGLPMPKIKKYGFVYIALSVRNARSG